MPQTMIKDYFSNWYEAYSNKTNCLHKKPHKAVQYLNYPYNSPLQARHKHTQTGVIHSCETMSAAHEDHFLYTHGWPFRTTVYKH